MRNLIFVSVIFLILPFSARANPNLKLVFTGQVSSSNQAGIPFAVQPIVVLRNEKNEVVSNVFCEVSLRLDGEHASDALLGIHVQRFLRGEADFNGLNLLVQTTLGGNSYRLLATGKGACADAKEAFSANFTVLPPETN